jgi:hypothetical protein
MPYPIKHGFLACWYARHITMEDFDIDDPGALKEVLAQRYAINARGWRLYLDYGDALFERLGVPWAEADNPYATGHNAVAYLRLLQACEMDVLPPLALLASMKDWRIPGHRLREVPPLFFRAAWKAWIAADYGDMPMDRFAAEALIPVARWFFATGQHAHAETSLLKRGWPALTRRFEEWQQQCSIRAEERKPAAPEWSPFVHRVEAAGWLFVALASEAALYAEGLAMVHCIGGYDSLCGDGLLRVFSMRHTKSGERAATLTVQTTAPGCWMVHDLKGRYNAPVPDALHLAALQVIDALHEAYALVPHIRAAMDHDWIVAEQQYSKEKRNDEFFDDCPF